MIKKVDLLDFSSNSLKFQQLFNLKMNQLILYKMFKKKIKNLKTILLN